MRLSVSVNELPNTYNPAKAKDPEVEYIFSGFLAFAGMTEAWIHTEAGMTTPSLRFYTVQILVDSFCQTGANARDVLQI